MASKYAQQPPTPPKHPAFVPNDVDQSDLSHDQRYFVRLMRETLSQAYELTPWERGVVILCRKEDLSAIANAVTLVSGAASRVFIQSHRKREIPKNKRVMIDPSGYRLQSWDWKHSPHPPWGPKPVEPEPPAPFVLS